MHHDFERPGSTPATGTPVVDVDTRHVAVRPGPPPLPGGRHLPRGLEAGPEEPSPGVDRTLRSRRRRAIYWVVAVAALFGLAIAFTGAYAAVLWKRIDRIDTAGTLAPTGDGFVNYLVVGTDDRSGVARDDPAAEDIGLGFEGSRSDSMILLHIGDDGNRIISLPRDLWVEVEGLGYGKLNSALGRGGAPLLISTIESHLGVPIHRYLQVDLAGFMSIVDTIGGVDIDFPSAACDPKSGLDVRRSGPVKLDRVTALAYVRSRTYTEFDPAAVAGLDCREIIASGMGSTDPTGDIGRTDRQRRVLLAALTKAAGSRNPFRLLSVASGLSAGLAVDDEMGFWDAVALARSTRGLQASTMALPVDNFDAPGGASALVLAPGAPEMLSLFGAATPGTARGQGTLDD